MQAEIKELEDTQSLYAQSKIEDDKLVIPGLKREDEEITAFRNKIKKVNKNIIGNATHDDINRIRTSTLGMALMQFRSWIPQMMQDRFGDLKKDADLEMYSMGKTSLFFSDRVSFLFTCVTLAIGRSV